MTYTSQIAMAERLIRTKGAACTWNSTAPAVDPAKPWIEIPSATTSRSVNIVLFPFDEHARRMLGYSQHDVVPTGTLMGLMPGSTIFTPALRDTVRVGTTTYTVTSIDTLNPNADDDIVYILELRR